jgi:hypothetical protein
MEKLRLIMKFCIYGRPLKNQDSTNTSKITKKVEQELEAVMKEIDLTTTKTRMTISC